MLSLFHWCDTRHSILLVQKENKQLGKYLSVNQSIKIFEILLMGRIFDNLFNNLAAKQFESRVCMASFLSLSVLGQFSANFFTRTYSNFHTNSCYPKKITFFLAIKIKSISISVKNILLHLPHSTYGHISIHIHKNLWHLLYTFRQNSCYVWIIGDLPLLRIHLHCCCFSSSFEDFVEYQIIQFIVFALRKIS